LAQHSAAAIWGIRPPHEGDVHIVSSRKARARKGLRVHRSASLNAAVHLGLPLTSAARTLHDLTPALTSRELERAVEEAVIRGPARRDELMTRPALRRATIEEPQIT